MSKTTAPELILVKNTLIENIKKNWNRINAGNVFENGQIQPYDLKPMQMVHLLRLRLAMGIC